jgi:hypothetical protein
MISFEKVQQNEVQRKSQHEQPKHSKEIDYLRAATPTWFATSPTQDIR